MERRGLVAGSSGAERRGATLRSRSATIGGLAGAAVGGSSGVARERSTVPKRRGRVVGLCVLVAALAAGGDRRPATGAGQSPPGVGQLLDRVLAVVGGQVILLSDVRLFLETGLVEPSGAADPVPPALERLIERRLILDEAARYVVEDPLQDEVDLRVGQIERRLGGPLGLAAALAATGYAPPDFEQVVRDDLRIERYLARRFPPPTQPSAADTAARQALIDDWLASLPARAAVIRVTP